MSALIDPKPGDRVETPKGFTRVVRDKRFGDHAGDIRYSTSTHRAAKTRVCWITTWRDWCRKNEAVEVTTNV